ncbi:MAG: thiamine phosphate synthase [Leptospirales bacterium]|nr:thiamine phosphate synthase [Leptospirales bacterium]
MNKYSLYVVTDETLSNGRSHAQITREAVDGGAGAIQLRDKKMSSAKLYAAALEMAEICKGRAIFIVNDRLDVALAAGADGVHLGQDDLPLKAARFLTPSDFIIGVSISSVDEALLAARDGADYVAVSPVFGTESKFYDTQAGCGLEMVSAVRRALPSDIPVIGIGGLSENNIPQTISAGADGIAVISAVVSSPDIKGAAERLLNIIRRAKSDNQ